MVVGHPVTLPMKAAGGAIVQNASGAVPWFQTNLYTYGNHSGSLVANKNDFTLTFKPEASPDGYSVCIDPAAPFPTDPAGGNGLSLGDDANVLVTLGGGHCFPGQSGHISSDLLLSFARSRVYWTIGYSLSRFVLRYRCDLFDRKCNPCLSPAP